VAAGTAAVLSPAGTALGGEPVPIHDAHQIVVAPDADKDFLTDQAELAIGYRPFRPDQNGNTFADGIELAVRCGAAIAQLPAADANDPARIHKTEKPLRGIEICEICGETVNMGQWRIVNPAQGLSMDVQGLPGSLSRFCRRIRRSSQPSNAFREPSRNSRPNCRRPDHCQNPAHAC